MKKKFRELRLKNSNEQKTITQLSGCIQEKFNGFNIICVEYSKKLRKKFNPINIINKPVKQPEKKNLCHTTTDISRAYKSSCNQGKKNKVLQGFAYECYLLELINIKDILKIVQLHLVLFIILTIKILLHLKKI